VTKQGGIVSIYYLGAIFGCFAGLFGHIAQLESRCSHITAAGLPIESAVLTVHSSAPSSPSSAALIGGGLQAATQNAAFILSAPVVTGIGTGALTTIIPVYVSETWTSHGRGKFLGLVFIVSLRHPSSH
jgi:MFS family permease